MDPNKPIFYALLKRKFDEDIVRGERNYGLLHGEDSMPGIRWYDRLLSRLGTLMVNFGLRLEERCAICSEQLMAEKEQTTPVLGRK